MSIPRAVPSDGSRSRSQSQSWSSSSLLVELVALGVQGSSDGEEEFRCDEGDVDANDGEDEDEDGEVMPDGVMNNARCVTSSDVERRKDSSSGAFCPWPSERSGKGGLFSQFEFHPRSQSDACRLTLR